jgi:hypothetical protein
MIRQEASCIGRKKEKREPASGCDAFASVSALAPSPKTEADRHRASRFTRQTVAQTQLRRRRGPRCVLDRPRDRRAAMEGRNTNQKKHKHERRAEINSVPYRG